LLLHLLLLLLLPLECLLVALQVCLLPLGPSPLPLWAVRHLY